MPSPRSSILVLSVLTLLLWCAPAHAERRTALVIGNGAYKTAPLKNPTNDAQDMADALRGMGFDVTLKLNATHREMEEAVRAFGAKLKQGGLGLFYYAGHGVQVAGENFLIPVDTKVDAEADVKFGALNAGMTLARMEDAGNDLNIVILDACRTNPFARSFRTAEQGLARMDAPKGSLVAYATAPGRVAADSGGTGRNGVYTGFLLRHMSTPGLKVEEALKRVRADVVRATADKQVPWESSSLIGDFYFLPLQKPEIQSPVAPAPVASTYSKPTETIQTVNKQPLNKVNSKAEDWVGKGLKAYTKGEYTEAAKLYRKGAEQDDAEAQVLLGSMYIEGKGVTKSYSSALRLFNSAAKRGYSDAQLLLGSMYFHGQGVGKDYSSAINWYRIAADNGNAEAQYSLGMIYLKGNGAAQNIAEAFKLFRKSAELGNSDAQTRLGIMYSTGQAVAQDSAEAIKWYRKAAEQGNANAKLALSLISSQGQGVPQNDAAAVKQFRMDADHGSAEAQYMLGLAYSLGKGVTQSSSDAAKWLLKAAEQGHTIAQFIIGDMHARGDGVVQNDAEAVRWYRKSADQGYDIAQRLLGVMYYAGKGVSKDLIAAHMWANLATSNGNAVAKQFRETIAKDMTPAQLTEAQQMAREWKPKAGQ